MKQVKMTFKDVGKITFPKYSKGPMLLMEWMQNIPNVRISVKTIDSPDDILSDLFQVRFSNSKELVTDCYNYIKSNI